MNRNVFVLLGWVMILAFFFTSCRKYEEGPNISFRSKEARIRNNWAIESITVNGVEHSKEPFYSKQKHYMYENGKYITTVYDPVTLELNNIDGEWLLLDNARVLALSQYNYTGNVDTTVEYNILKLFEKQLWLRSLDNRIEMHLVPFDE